MRKNVWEAAPPSDRWGEVYMALISMDDMEPCPEFSSLWARISETQKPKEFAELFAELVLKYRNCLEDSISYIEDYGGERAKRATREMLLWASAAKAAEELAEFNDALIHGSGELPTYIHSILHEAEGLLVEAARHALADQSEKVHMAHFEAAMENFTVNTGERVNWLKNTIQAILSQPDAPVIRQLLPKI